MKTTVIIIRWYSVTFQWRQKPSLSTLEFERRTAIELDLEALAVTVEDIHEIFMILDARERIESRVINGDV